MPRIVHPHIHPLEVMHGEAERPVDVFAMAHIARDSHSALEMSHARPRRLNPAGIARQHHHSRAVIGKYLRDGLSDTHRSARDHDNFSRKIHARVVCCRAR